MTNRATEVITTTEAKPITLAYIIRSSLSGIRCYDSTFDVHGVCWALPHDDFTGMIIVDLVSDEIEVIELLEDRCIVDFASFVREHYDFFKEINLKGWEPKFSDDPEKMENNIKIGIEMLMEFVAGNYVESDGRKFIDHMIQHKQGFGGETLSYKCPNCGYESEVYRPVGPCRMMLRCKCGTNLEIQYRADRSYTVEASSRTPHIMEMAEARL